MKLSIIPFLITVFVLPTVITAQTTHTVAQDGSGDFFTIQAAVDASGNGDTILVSPGTYTGSGNEVVNIEGSYQEGGKEIILRGSAGASFTFIDGQGERRGISSVNNDAVLIEGFTVLNGYVSGKGGGILCRNSSPEIRYCNFFQNVSAFRGGGMGLQGSSAHVHDCTFTDNSAEIGGGLHAYNDSVLNIDDCDFSFNDADFGGGMYTSGGIDGVVTTCSFDLNLAREGGGGWYIKDTSDPEIINCTFSTNLAPNKMGGGMLCFGAPVIDGCTFDRNMSGVGGGIYLSNSAAALSSCMFEGNEAINYGGGSYVCTSTSSFYQCNFLNNIARIDGGGIAVRMGEVAIEQCSIESNSAGSMGGGMYLVAVSNVTIGETSVAGNTAGNAGLHRNSGGGISLISCGSVFIGNGSTFTENAASGCGGGINCVGESSITIENVDFQLNNAKSGGGLCAQGILSSDGITALMADLDVSQCQFVSNSSAFSGGGVSIYPYCDASIQNCQFIENDAVHNEQGLGGGLHISGGNGNEDTLSLFIANSLFEHNEADSGGGISSAHCDDVVITDCQVVSNHANQSGGGIECDNHATPELSNTLVCDNTPDQLNGPFVDNGGNTIGQGCNESNADTNDDGEVDVNDLIEVFEYWGTDDQHVDFDVDGVVGVQDVLIVISEWSKPKKKDKEVSSPKKQNKYRHLQWLEEQDSKGKR